LVRPHLELQVQPQVLLAPVSLLLFLLSAAVLLMGLQLAAMSL